MIKTKVRRYDLLMYVYFFLVFFYVFNISFIKQLGYSSTVLAAILLIASLVLLMASSKLINKKKRNGLLIALVILSSIITFRNGDIANSSMVPYLNYIFILFSVYLLSLSNKWHKIAIKVLNIFVMEHILGSFFCYLFPGVYHDSIMPIFKEAQDVLTWQFDHNQIAGLTQHYSTNALYLIAGLLVNTAFIVVDKSKKKSKYLFIILNIIALLLTGKRSQVIYYFLIVLILLFIKYRNRIHLYVKKMITIIVLLTGLLSVGTIFIPSIANSFIRAYNSINNESSMNTRNVLYDLALDEFNNNKLIGVGWSNYKYLYHQKMPRSMKEMEYMQVHNTYLQVLCETGLIGAAIIFSLLLWLLVLTIKDIKGSEKETNKDSRTQLLYMFLAYHLFFLMEGVLGNSLYDLQTYIPYAVVLSMFLYYHFEMRKEFDANEKALHS